MLGKRIWVGKNVAVIAGIKIGKVLLFSTHFLS